MSNDGAKLIGPALFAGIFGLKYCDSCVRAVKHTDDIRYVRHIPTTPPVGRIPYDSANDIRPAFNSFDDSVGAIESFDEFRNTGSKLGGAEEASTRSDFVADLVVGSVDQVVDALDEITDLPSQYRQTLFLVGYERGTPPSDALAAGLDLLYRDPEAFFAAAEQLSRNVDIEQYRWLMTARSKLVRSNLEPVARRVFEKTVDARRLTNQDIGEVIADIAQLSFEDVDRIDVHLSDDGKRIVFELEKEDDVYTVEVDTSVVIASSTGGAGVTYRSAVRRETVTQRCAEERSFEEEHHSFRVRCRPKPARRPSKARR